MDRPVSLDKLMALCTRRGFIFQSNDLYGGLAGCWDYGPLGAELKSNLKHAWWQTMVQRRDDMVGFDGSVLTTPQVWLASGHDAFLQEDLAQCGSCQRVFHLDELTVDGTCPVDGGLVRDPQPCSLLLRAHIGKGACCDAVVLRPEALQSLFLNFVQVQRSMNRRIPFGIAQIGRAFRNESSPGGFGTRPREFEQMECAYFVRADDAVHTFEAWLWERLQWYCRLGIPSTLLRVHRHAPEELTFHSVAEASVQFSFPEGWVALESIEYRGDHDLARHMHASGRSLYALDHANSTRFVPHAITASASLDRVLLALLSAAYEEEPDRAGVRTVLRILPLLAPTKVAVLPLSRTADLCTPARQLASRFRHDFAAAYDETASIGKRYRRQDEIGTPICVTIDFETLHDRAVTIRDRDTMSQDRVPIEDVVERVRCVLALDD